MENMKREIERGRERKYGGTIVFVMTVTTFILFYFKKLNLMYQEIVYFILIM